MGNGEWGMGDRRRRGGATGQVIAVKQDQLPELIGGKDRIIREYGGSLAYNHLEWVESVAKQESAEFEAYTKAKAAGASVAVALAAADAVPGPPGMAAIAAAPDTATALPAATAGVAHRPVPPST